MLLLVKESDDVALMTHVECVDSLSETPSPRIVDMYVCIDSSSDPLTASFWASKLEKFKKSNN
jgi:hypothetical protein